MARLGLRQSVYLDNVVRDKLEEFRQLKDWSLSRMINDVLREALGIPRNVMEVRKYTVEALAACVRGRITAYIRG